MTPARSCADAALYLAHPCELEVPTVTLDALPAAVPLGIEVPVARLQPSSPPGERLRYLASTPRSFLEQGLPA